MRRKERLISFLRATVFSNMVRIMAGTLIEIGTGDREPETIKEVFRTKNREKAGMTLPPQGLFLDEVFYE